MSEFFISGNVCVMGAFSMSDGFQNGTGKPPHVANRGGVAYNKPKPPTSEKDPRKEEKLTEHIVMSGQGRDFPVTF